MNSFEKAIYTLEFDKIREKLSSLARTEAARKALLEIKPSSDPVIVARLTEETTKAKDMVVVKGAAPFGGAKDITALLDRAARGGVLSAAELLSVASNLKAVAALLKYKGGDCGCLNSYFNIYCSVFSWSINRKLFFGCCSPQSEQRKRIMGFLFSFGLAALTAAIKNGLAFIQHKTMMAGKML